MKARATRNCKIYKSCKNVPCNQAMNKCKPSYCVPGSSRNWTHCNMSKYKHLCKDESKCSLSKSRKVTQDTVDAKTLHNKMPYIWRFLKPKTRRHMIKLANKPVKDINIPFHVFPEGVRVKGMNSRLKRLREKYKDI